MQKFVHSSDIFVCDIGIQDKEIILLEKNINQKSKEIIDADGRYVLPGGIDAHCHLDQPMKDGSVIADNFETGTKICCFWRHNNSHSFCSSI